MDNIDFKELNNKLEDARKESYNLIDKINKRLEVLSKAYIKAKAKADEKYDEYMELLDLNLYEDDIEAAEEEYEDADFIVRSIDAETENLQNILDELREMSFDGFGLEGFDQEVNDKAIKDLNN